jgi:hypothetical protein
VLPKCYPNERRIKSVSGKLSVDNAQPLCLLISFLQTFLALGIVWMVFPALGSHVDGVIQSRPNPITSDPDPSCYKR